MAFDPRGRGLAVAAADGTVQVWDPARPHRPVAFFTGHAGNVNALAYSPTAGPWSRPAPTGPCGCGTPAAPARRWC